MANNSNDNISSNEESPKDSGLDKSIVGKFVSGLINNTPLSKWFGKETPKSTVRRRQADEEDESLNLQPPNKRPKIPQQLNSYGNNNSFYEFSYNLPKNRSDNHITLPSTSSTVNYNSFTNEPVAGPSSGIYRSKTDYSIPSTNSVTNSWGVEGTVNGNVDTDSDDDGTSTSEYLSATRGKQINRKQEKRTEHNININRTENFIDKSVAGDNNNIRTMASTAAAAGTTTTTRSLFSENNLNSTRHGKNFTTSLSSRGPTFNSSVFGTPNFVDKTLATEKLLNSPFYNGKTIYGGASAYARKLGQSVAANNLQKSLRVKPINQTKSISENMALSKTARRILNTLEQYSTPIGEAKKIPIQTTRSDGLLTKYIGVNPYIVKGTPKTRELQVPSVPELLKMKQKEKLQSSTENVRQIAINSQSTLNKEEYKLGNTNEDNNKQQKYTSKIRNTITSVRQKVQPANDVLPEVNLPQVSLQITTLPKFDLNIPPPSSTTFTSSLPPKSNENNNNKAKAEEKVQENKKDNVQFKFSNPLIIAEKSLKTIAPINNFKFSEPLPKNINKKDVNILKTKNNGENVFITKKDEIKEQEQNKNKNSFGEQFKLSSDKWECSVCLVRNNEKDTKCVACTTPRHQNLSTSDKLKPTVSINNGCENKFNTSNSIVSNFNGFGDKFKPANETWECPSCMIRNKNDITKCVACETIKPGTENSTKIQNKEDWNNKTISTGNKNLFKDTQTNDKNKDSQNDSLMNKFKPSISTWECPTCMIRNKNEDVKCVACETGKPGHKQENKPSTNVTGPTFNFGIKPQNTEEKPSTSASFTFGVKPTADKNPTPSPSGFTFGVKPTDKINTPTTGFTFGIKPSDDKKDSSTPTNSFNFLNKSSEDQKTTPKSSSTTTVTNNSQEDLRPTSKGSIFGGKPVINFDIKPTETWECKSCKMINRVITEQCKSCNAPTPKSVLDGHKKPSKEWECPTCLVKNKEEINQCVCCSYVKEQQIIGIKSEKPKSKFNYGIMDPLVTFGVNKNETKTEQPSLQAVVTTTTTTSLTASAPALIETTTTTKPKEIPSSNSLKTSNYKFTPIESSQNEIKKDLSSATTTITTTAVATETTTPTLFGSTTTTKTATTAPAIPKFEFKPPSVNGELEKKNENDKPVSTLFLKVNPSSIQQQQTPTFNFQAKTDSATTTKINSTSLNSNVNSNMFKFGSASASTTSEPLKSSTATISTKEINNATNSFASSTTKPLFSQPQFNSGGDNKIVFGSNSKNNNNNDDDDGPPKNKIPTFSFSEKTSVSSPAFNFSAPTSLSTTTTTNNNIGSSGGFNFTTTTKATPNFNFSSGNINNNNNSKDGVATAQPTPQIFSFGGNSNATNGIFNFGSGANNTTTNNSQKALFNFGGSSQTATIPNQTNFNFGNTAPPASISGSEAFNFTGGPPTFNFTDGNPGQMQGSLPPRKIKKAVRRTLR